MTPHALIAPARLAGAPLLRAQSDERLVDLVRAGNVAAFEAIVTRYRRPLLRYCSRLVSEPRAEDAVQQAFLRAFDSLRASEGEMSLRPWLYRIAHNTALNALRDRALSHEELSEEIDGVERPDQAYEKRQRLRDVVAAVGALPDRQRDAIVLRELEGRSYEEIAHELGVSGGAVRQLLSRARTSLRAGMTAVTPWGLLVRLPWGANPGEGVAARVSEMCGAGAGGALVAKACVTALVTGAVVGGVVGAPGGGPGGGRAQGPGSEARAAAPHSLGVSTLPEAGGDAHPGDVHGGRRHGPDDGSGDRRGRGGDDGFHAGERRHSGRDGGSDDGGGERSGGGGERSGSDDRSGGESHSGDGGSGSGSSGSDDPVSETADSSGPGGGDSTPDGSDSSGPGSGDPLPGGVLPGTSGSGKGPGSETGSGSGEALSLDD